MAFKYSHQLIRGMSFGLTTAVITSLGMIIGMRAATQSRIAIIAGLAVMAVTDGISDALSMHVAEEAETESGEAKHSRGEIWLTTLFTFIAVTGFSMTFALPIAVLPLNIAVYADLAWGFALLFLLNLYIARITGRNPALTIGKNIGLAVAVIILSHFTGALIKAGFE